MKIVFPDADFPFECRGEIDDVLQRICIGNGFGQWPDQPDEIEIIQRLAGGRSGSEVLKVAVKHGSREAYKVIKIGPAYELKNEYKAYRAHLRDASAQFVRIEAATPDVLDGQMAGSEEREAIVYDHASRFQGKPHSKARTFEDLTREAIADGGPSLEQAINALRELFQGVRNDLYEKREVIKQESTLEKAWNLRLGIDAVIAVDRCNKERQALDITAPSSAQPLRPRDIAEASVQAGRQPVKEETVHLNKATIRWWGERLMAEDAAHHLRIEVITDGTGPIRKLAPDITEGSQWKIRGRLIALRMSTHKARLLDGLGKRFKLSEDALSGSEARVRDPFVMLPDILRRNRPFRVTSVIHGDLNPRNILVIDKTPCLIDYAFTNSGEPIFMDFTRLEGSLTREVLPDDLSWKQHVRLQRLLAAACRLGDEAADGFVRQLEADSAILARSFRLLWTIRREAREVYPQEYRNQWARNYIEQLFLFAHLTLKWDGEEDASSNKLRATAAIMGVAAEVLSDTDSYRFWDEDALRADGGSIIRIISSQPGSYLREIANLARALQYLNLKQTDPLQSEFEKIRAEFVKQHFHDAANKIINDLYKDHDVYINLKAYIDLKGQLNAGRKRQLHSEEEMLINDELMAERERLRAGSGNDKDVLRLIAENTAVLVIGDAGSGKSTVAREWEYRLARSITDQNEFFTVAGPEDQTGKQSLLPEAADERQLFIEPRMPIILRAPDLPARLTNWKQDTPRSTVAVLNHDESDIDLLSIGALYIIVDALNELAEKQKKQVADWIITLRKAFPGTPVLALHRQYNYVPGLIPFPVITLQKVEIEQARSYIQNYLREKEVQDHDQLAQRLIKLMLDDPDYTQIRDLAQTPLFLWMIVERYRITEKIPRSRGGLFETFTRWYLEERYHEAHKELTETSYSYADKVLLLGALGHELVQRHETILPEKEVRGLVPAAIKRRWRKVLDEIITSEMLQRDGKNLRFLHQSFQEYFAARHFLTTEGRNPAAIRHKVWELGWHDTFAVLLGFAGDETEIVTQVIEEALKVNPILTARCLRMAEQPDARLLRRFIAMQETILQDASAGTFAHERAARALAEQGQKEARETLWRIFTDKTAPDVSRVQALTRLADMPSQARFEMEADQIRQELISNIPDVFDKPDSMLIRQAAINAIATTQLKNLSPHLAEMVASGEWPLCRDAWQACSKLDLKLTNNQQAAFTEACRGRLDKAEAELYQESITVRIDELNEERTEILRQLATPSNLPLLLKRRFGYGIQTEMREIINGVILTDGQPPAEAQQAWSILVEEPEDEIAAMIRWIELLRNPDDLTALAAAHRLITVSENLPCEKLIPLFDPTPSPDRLSAIANLAGACEDENLSQPLEALIRSLIELIVSREWFEALANLVAALKNLDYSVGNRVAAVVNVSLWTDYDESRYQHFPWHFPWLVESISSDLDDEDYEILLAAGEKDARAAVFNLNARGAGMAQIAGNVNCIKLDNTALQQLLDLAEAEQDLYWQSLFAGASVKVQAVNLLPWLIDTALEVEKTGSQITSYSSLYGTITELDVDKMMQAIGYLARVLLDKKQADEARPAVAFLRERYAALTQDDERYILVSLTTGLGYIGDWQPILTQLGSEEPWMHDAAKNVFQHWVPTPLSSASDATQLEDAAIWITRRLRDNADLSPQARSTLEHIKEQLETKLGRHIPIDNE